MKVRVGNTRVDIDVFDEEEVALEPCNGLSPLNDVAISHFYRACVNTREMHAGHTEVRFKTVIF